MAMTSRLAAFRPSASQREGHAGSVSAGVLEAFDLLNFGVLVLDDEGGITFTNRAAKALLQLGGRQTVGSVTQRLVQRARSAILQREAYADRCFFMPLASGKTLTIRMELFHDGDAGSANKAAAVLFISDQMAALQPELRPIVRLYGLTGAESRLLEALVTGHRIDEYAKRANITLNTAKAYLKQLFAKTRTSRQSELIRFVLANPILHVVSAGEADGR